MRSFVLFALAATFLFSCSANKQEKEEIPESESVDQKPPIVNISSNFMDIIMEDTLKAGMNHLIYENNSSMTISAGRNYGHVPPATPVWKLVP